MTIGLYPSSGLIVGGKHKLVEKISSGGGGDVWISETNGKQVALKLLKWSPLKDKDVVANKFKEEFTIMKGVSHENVAEIYDFGFDRDFDRYFFTQELITGGDLRDYKLSTIEVIEEFLYQMLEALNYLWHRNIIHLDIKPQNILIKKAGKPIPVLIDFGLATFRSPDHPGGTPSYMSPEIIAKRLNLSGYFPPDHKSDIYSLGVTFYMCLTGINPFRKIDENGKLDVNGTMQNHLSLKVNPPSYFRPDIPEYLDKVIMRMIARKPSDRYQTARSILEALNYRSTRQIQNRIKISSFIPESGQIVGRKTELKIIEKACHNLTNKLTSLETIVIAGPYGCGKTRFIEAAKIIAQKSGFDVLNISRLKNLPKSFSKPTCITIDNLDKFKNTNEAFDEFIHSIRWHQRKTESLESSTPLAVLFGLKSRSENIEKTILEYKLDTLNPRIIPLKSFSISELTEYLLMLTGNLPSISTLATLMEVTSGYPLFVSYIIKRLANEDGLPLSCSLEEITKYVPYLKHHDFSRDEISHFVPESILQYSKIIDYYSSLKRAFTMDELRKLKFDKKISKQDLLFLTTEDVLPLLFSILWENTIPEPKRNKIHLALSKITVGTEKKVHLAHANNSDSIKSAMSLINIQTSKIKNNDVELSINEKLKILHPSVIMNRNEALQTIYYATKLLSQELDSEEKFKVEEALSDAYIKMGRYDKACDVFDEWETLGESGELNHRNGHSQNNSEMEPYISFYSYHLKLRGVIEKGKIHLIKRDYESALNFFEDALSIVSNIPTSAMSPFKKNKLSEHTISYYQKKWSAFIKNYIGGIKMRQNKLDDAEKIFLSTIDENLDNNELAETYLLTGRAKQAYDLLIKKKNMTSGFELTHNEILMGNSLRQLKEIPDNFNMARRHYEQAIALAKNGEWWGIEINAYHKLGNLYIETGKPLQAIESFQNALVLSKELQMDSTTVELMTSLGQAYRGQNKFKEALEQFESAWDYSHMARGQNAVFLIKWWPQLLVLLADTHLNLGDLVQARAKLDLAIEYDQKQDLPISVRYSIYGTIAEIEIKEKNINALKDLIPTLENIAKQSTHTLEHFRNLKQQATLLIQGVTH